MIVRESIGGEPQQFPSAFRAALLMIADRCQQLLDGLVLTGDIALGVEHIPHNIGVVELLDDHAGLFRVVVGVVVTPRQDLKTALSVGGVLSRRLALGAPKRPTAIVGLDQYVTHAKLSQLFPGGHRVRIAPSSDLPEPESDTEVGDGLRLVDAGHVDRRHRRHRSPDLNHPLAHHGRPRPNRDLESHHDRQHRREDDSDSRAFLPPRGGEAKRAQSIVVTIHVYRHSRVALSADADQVRWWTF